MSTEGAELLDELRDALTRYVVFPDLHAANAVTLWIAATHVQPAWEHAPRLVITAPEKRCGKSRLLDIVEATCYDPLITVNASVAAVVRSISLDPPTLLVDESDTIFGPKASKDNEDLRGILNAGHQRNRPAIRFNVNSDSVQKLHTFAMAALAGIGDMPDTITDRAVVIRMRRRAPGETVSPYRTRRDRPALVSLAGRLHTWAREGETELMASAPDMPVEDRAADTWEPLVAIADFAGGDWSKRVRAAAEAFTSAADEADSERSLSMRLLSDIRDIFGASAFMGSAVLVERLNAVEDAPWSVIGKDGLTQRTLANRLRPYGISSGHNSSRDTRGYHLADFGDAFARYLRPLASKRPESSIDAGQDTDARTDASESSKRPDATGNPKRPSIRPSNDQGKHPESDAWTLEDASGREESAAHMWWPARRTGEHGPDCPGCRRSTGGPDHTNPKETTR